MIQIRSLSLVKANQFFQSAIRNGISATAACSGYDRLVIIFMTKVDAIDFHSLGRAGPRVDKPASKAFCWRLSNGGGEGDCQQ